MMIVTVRRRRSALVAVCLATLAVRLALELTDRVYFRMTGDATSMAESTDATEQARLIGRPVSPDNGSEQLASVDLDLSIEYPNYVPSLPRFVNGDDRLVFMNDASNSVHFATPAHQLIGRVRVVWNGVVRPRHECSWKTSNDEFERQGADGGPSTTTTFVNKTLCPLLVPDGQTFQHFVDGVLPKLIQLLTEASRLAAAVDQFVVYRPRDAIVYELLERVGIGRDRLLVVPVDWSRLIEASCVVDTCVTPSLHPTLWRRASQMLRIYQHRDLHQKTLNTESEWSNSVVDDHGGPLGGKNEDSRHHGGRELTANSSLVILLSRRWTRNAGRRLLNENAVLDYLLGRFGHRRVTRFGDGRTDLATAGRLFSRAVAVVGVHGGAFYNIVLASRGCVVVEVMPLVDHVAPPGGLAHTVVWRVAGALGHTYWRLYANATSSRRADVTLSIDNLRSALSGVT